MKRRPNIALIALGGLIFILLIFQVPLMRSVRNYVWGGWVATVGHVFGYQNQAEDNGAAAQIKQLLSENTLLRAQLQDYKQLRKQLGQPAFDHYKTISAAVEARPLDTYHAQYILDRGLKDGIAADTPVIINGSTLIGFVTEVHDRTAVLQLLIHPETGLTVETVPKDEGAAAGRGLLQSQHYSSLVLTTVPRDIPLHDGEKVVTVPKDNVIPGGLYIGDIQHIRNALNQAYQEADVVFPYSLDAISAVNVLVPL